MKKGVLYSPDTPVSGFSLRQETDRSTAGRGCGHVTCKLEVAQLLLLIKVKSLVISKINGLKIGQLTENEYLYNTKKQPN